MFCVQHHEGVWDGIRAGVKIAAIQRFSDHRISSNRIHTNSNMNL